MKATRYIVYIRDRDYWVDIGEGELTKIQAERIAKEIRSDSGIMCKVLPVGCEPNMKR